MSEPVERPIFLVGMPRSGTTLIFEAFAAHPDLAWLSQYMDIAPRFRALAVMSRIADVDPRLRRSVNRSDRPRPLLQRALPGPSEAYRVWERCCGSKFRYSYLLRAIAPPKEADCVRHLTASVVRLQSKRRFAAKLTGPGRISYLSSIFPDALFVHVVRDGRAVVRSLLSVPFWHRRARMLRPAWEGGLEPQDMAEWERFGQTPLALAAIQWRRVVETTRQEGERLADGQYLETNYERFLSNPDEVLAHIFNWCGLPPSPRATSFLRSRFELRDMNFQWRNEYDLGQRAILERLLDPTLKLFGYAA